MAEKFLRGQGETFFKKFPLQCERDESLTTILLGIKLAKKKDDNNR